MHSRNYFSIVWLLSATILVAFWKAINQSPCRQSLIGCLVTRTTMTVYSVQLMVLFQIQYHDVHAHTMLVIEWFIVIH